MREEAFNFLVNLINSTRIGSVITRAQAIRHLLGIYKPGPKSPAQSGCRASSDRFFTFFVNEGILQRVDRGVFVILSHVPDSMKYEYVTNKIYKMANERKRKDNRT